MKNLYQSYLRAFHKYAISTMQNKLILSITRFALLINLKANQLIDRATWNKLVNLPVLQTAIFEAGRDYINNFAARKNLERALRNVKHPLS